MPGQRESQATRREQILEAAYEVALRRGIDGLTVRAVAATVRSGRRATMAIAMNTAAGPDNPSPVTHHVVQGHDIDIGSSGVTFATDYVGLAFHGDCHTHMDALCHIAYQGLVYNGRPAQQVMTSKGATALDVTAYREGLVGRGVLLDVPRFRGIRWLEPGEAVTRAEIDFKGAARLGDRLEATVDFEATGRARLTARTIQTYGESLDPSRRTSADQTRLFSRERWVSFPWTARQVRRDAVRTYVVRGR